MILRIVRFRLRPQVSDTDTQEMLAHLGTVVKTVPTIRRFNIGPRLDYIPGYKLDTAEGTAVQQTTPVGVEYVAVFEFENEIGLLTYLRHPAQKTLQDKFLTLVDLAEAADYKM